VRLTEDGPALSFMRPKFKRDGSGQIVAEQPWSIYDPSTCSPERLIFDGQPEVAAKDAAQITLLPPAVDVVPGRRADLKLFQDLSQAEQAAALQHGVRLERTRTPGGHKPGTSGPRLVVPFLVVSNLRLDQELELADGTVKTVGRLWVEEAPKTRCQAHLRESVSLAAYYNVHLSGVPFVFDAGVSTKYQLHPEDVVGPPVEAFEAHVVSWAAAQRPGVAETEIERQVNRIGKACGRHETSSLLIHTLAERLVKALRHLFDQTVMPDKELLKHLERQLNREARQAAKQQQSAPTTGRIDNYDLLERMNRSHAVIAIGGSTRIVQIDAYDPDMKQTYYRVMQKGDFELRHCNELVRVGKSYEPLGTWWLEHPYRRQHLQGLALDPSRRLGPDYLNMWKDWGVQPCDGDPSVFLEHIEFLASDPGNGADMQAYILGWLATKVQHPERPAETALVLRGDHGAGKGALARVVQAMFGAHARLIAKGEHFIGKFNSHLEDCCLLICDEAVWAGDPRQLESLKSLITEPTMMYEKKFVDAREGVNHLGVIMMSNRNFVVRVERGDRRFVMVDVASDRIRDKAYWKRYSEALADPVQVGAFLKFLLEYDLSGFDIRAIPSSVARTDQKLETQGHEERWLQEVLHRGRFSSTAYTVNSYGRTCEINPVWEEWVVAERLRDDYKLYMQSINQARFTKDPRTFGKFLANYFPRRRTKHGWGYDLGPLEAAARRSRLTSSWTS